MKSRSLALFRCAKKPHRTGWHLSWWSCQAPYCFHTPERPQYQEGRMSPAAPQKRFKAHQPSASFSACLLLHEQLQKRRRAGAANTNPTDTARYALPCVTRLAVFFSPRRLPPDGGLCLAYSRLEDRSNRQRIVSSAKTRRRLMRPTPLPLREYAPCQRME